MLKTEALSVRFGGLSALSQVNFEAVRDEVRAIIGPNGAGKSTFFNCLTGVLRPSGGRIVFDGEDITGLPSNQISQKGIARSYQITDINQKAEQALQAVGLLSKAREFASNLSHGEQRTLEIGIALATEPKLLCLDEPTAGMSQAETEDTKQLVRRIARDLTILIVEHDMQVVMELCHRITVLHYGAILAEGTPEEIQNNPKVLEVYLKT
jgi:branched-chain amino acid transport system ATP-binding protein